MFGRAAVAMAISRVCVCVCSQYMLCLAPVPHPQPGGPSRISWVSTFTTNNRNLAVRGLNKDIHDDIKHDEGLQVCAHVCVYNMCSSQLVCRGERKTLETST